MSSLDKLVPNLSNGIITKILIVEIYFLLRSGQSPVYFSLLDFADNYSIELIYITVALTLLTGWIIIPALAVYMTVAGILSWMARLALSRFKYKGTPIFVALGQEYRDKRVSLSVAKKFAHSKSDSDLQSRIEKYESSSNQSQTIEVRASANFALILVIACVSYSTGAPNFMMRVTSFVDPYLSGLGYEICLLLLIIQGVLGRISNFHTFAATGYLPPHFFKNEDERSTVAAWAHQETQHYIPLARKWLSR